LSSPFAILDTDFTSKLHTTTNTEGMPLIEYLLKLPYTFCCHEQIKKELSVHNNAAEKWLRSKIAARIITCYTDKDIILFIQSSFRSSFASAKMFYLSYLRESCEIYSRNFYQTYFGSLETPDDIPIDSFCQKIDCCDKQIGRQNDLGEIKDTLLLLALRNCTGNKIFNLCSDDKTARRSIIRYHEDDEIRISCISAFGFFFVAKVKRLFEKAEAEQFLQSWLKLHNGRCTISIETHTSRPQPDFPKMDAGEVFQHIWDGSMVMRCDGFMTGRK
jgi:hypothetical protein